MNETTSTPPQTTSPQATPDADNRFKPAFGWTFYAEQINGRFAMLGFVALLILEFFTREDFWTWLGLR